MKRRLAIQSILGLSGAAAAPQAQVEEVPKLESAGPEAVAEGVPRFFSPDAYSALARLADLLLPPRDPAPGAGQARVAHFLDFLISSSPRGRQALYIHGLEALNKQAHTRYGRWFAELSFGQADSILEPLRRPWTYEEPADPLARFLRAAKDDVMLATVNSREYAEALSGSRRGAQGLGLYWTPIE